MCTVYHVRSRNIAQCTLHKMSALSCFHSAPLLTCCPHYSPVVQSLTRFFVLPSDLSAFCLSSTKSSSDYFWPLASVLGTWLYSLTSILSSDITYYLHIHDGLIISRVFRGWSDATTLGDLIAQLFRPPQLCISAHVHVERSTIRIMFTFLPR